MHPISKGARVGALALSLALCTVSVACKDGGGPSLDVFDASGGDGSSADGFGGDAAEVDLYIDYGGTGSIDVQSGGSVDASFTPTGLLSPDLGANPLTVTGNLSIAVVVSAPAQGTPYMLADDDTLYVSDGDMDMGDETPVTGLQVQSGATLTLGLNADAGETAGLSFTSDVVNDGTITTVDYDATQRGDLSLFSEGDYVGSGRLSTFGSQPGQSGGDIAVEVMGNGYNSGRWASYGANNSAGDGGDGGDIDFETTYETPGGRIENTGDMVSNGGKATGTTGVGGDAGGIDITPYLALWNSGDLDAIGGNGVTGGGNGGNILIAGYFRGELRNTGALTSDGGDTAGGSGGDGGDLDLEGWGDDLRSSGRLLARGGNTSAAGEDAGAGGDIFIYTTSSDDNYEASELDVPAGDLWVSGGAVATGGDARASGGAGGAGGTVELEIENAISEGTQAIHVRGIKRLDAQGGDGGMAGGAGDSVYLDLASTIAMPSGSVTVQPPMNSSGGDADPNLMGSFGGDAGPIEIYAGTISYGSATADGGTGETPGADGMITPETP